MPNRSLSSLLTIFLFSAVAQAEDKFNISPLPTDKAYELHQAQGCSCSLFRRGTNQNPENVLLSVIPDESRIYLNDKTISLIRTAPPTGKNTFINHYKGDNVFVTTKMHQVDYGKFCSEYTDPPTEGSCFAGKLSVKYKNSFKSFQIIGVCGC